jgi:hypothetical protein
MFEVGTMYTDENGTERKCIAIEGDYAYLIHNAGRGNRWRMDGTAIDLGSGYDIPAPSPRPIIPWYPGNTAPKDGKPFMAKFYEAIVILTYLDGKYMLAWDASVINIKHVDKWSPLPQ